MIYYNHKIAKEKQNMAKTVFGALSAGIMISIGGSVFLACDNKYVGAVLFSVALLCICNLGYYLYTGKIAYLANDFSKKNICHIKYTNILL